MDFSSVYAMGDGFVYGALDLCPREDITDPYALLRAEVRPGSPLVFEYQSGGRARDLIGTGYAVLFLLSDDVIDVLRSETFTGWTTFPVVIYGKNRERIEGYHGFSVTGRCGPIDNSRSRRIMRKPPVPSGQWSPGWLGVYFDPATWDGSDIFTPEGTGWKFVVQRVKDALIRAKVKNIRFQRLTEIERSMLS